VVADTSVPLGFCCLIDKTCLLEAVPNEESFPPTANSVGGQINCVESSELFHDGGGGFDQGVGDLHTGRFRHLQIDYHTAFRIAGHGNLRR